MRKSNWMILSFVLIIVFLGILIHPTQAAPNEFTTLPVSEDATIAISDDDGNWNGQWNRVQSQQTFEGQVNTYIILLKFNNIDMANPIVTGILGLYGSTCNGFLPFDEIRVDLYGVTDDSWSESTVTWNSATDPSSIRGDYLATIDTGTTVVDAYNTWSDYNNGNLAQYLQAANLSNGGDGTVSFWLEINDSGLVLDAAFMDKEYTGFCGDPYLPYLTISDEIPTAVGLQTFEARASGLFWPAVSLSVVLAAGAALLLLRKRRKI